MKSINIYKTAEIFILHVVDPRMNGLIWGVCGPIMPIVRYFGIMYVCMYVCTYLRMYVCTFVRMYACMYARIAQKLAKTVIQYSINNTNAHI
jgi:hypothetical protein